MRCARVRIAAAAAVFVAALVLFGGLGLLLTRGRVGGWVPIIRDDRGAGGPEDEPGGRYVQLPAGLLGEWEDAGRDPPPHVADFDGSAVEICGLVRPAATEPGGAEGFWLVTDPVALREGSKPVVETSVWLEPPEGVSPARPLERGAFVRARGVLRIGLAEVPGVGPVALRLELRDLWLREPPGRTKVGATADERR